MSNLSDIFLAIRALGPEDIRAFAETAKLAITEEERRRLDAIPPIPEVDEAREIPVTSTYPVIYISNEDLKKATHRTIPNPCKNPGQPAEIFTFVEDADTPIVGGYNANVSFACYKDISSNSFVCLEEPRQSLDIKIISTRLDEKVVFVFGKTEQEQQTHHNLSVVVTNYGNIYSGVRKDQYGQNVTRLQPYPTYKDGQIGNLTKNIVSPGIESNDEFCRVPQTFVDLMAFVLRSFRFSKKGYGWDPEINEDYFKSLCRQYNKDRKDLRDGIRERDAQIDAATSNITTLERVIQEREEYIKTLEETITELRNSEEAYAVLNDRYKSICDKMIEERETFERDLKKKEETYTGEIDRLGQDIASEFKLYDQLDKNYKDLEEKYIKVYNERISVTETILVLVLVFFMSMCARLYNLF